MKTVIDKDKLNKIINFINLEFEKDNNNNSTYIKNYKKLIEFLELKKYVINEFEAEYLIKNIPSLLDIIYAVRSIKLDVPSCIKSMFTLYDDEFDLDFDIDCELGSSVNMYIQQIKGFKVLSREEEKELFELANKGNELARKKIINHNLKLVVNNAKRFANSGIAIEDLIQEGNIGLINCVSTFDETRGFKFSTYATYSIRQKMKRYIDNTSRTIRIPVAAWERNEKLGVIKREFKNKYFRNPTIKELSTLSGYSIQTISILERALIGTLSIDDKIQPDYDGTLGDYIVSDTDLEEELIQRIYAAKTLESLYEKAKISETEQKVLLYKYVYGYSFKEIGQFLNGITKQRVKSIETSAVMKLKKAKSLI
ncbi:MAG: RNA polymerase sigma factor RpoD/SigA [Bacilli bacterium]